MSDKIKCRYILLAEKVLIDDRTNSASAISIIDSFDSFKFPFFVPEMHLLICMEKPDGVTLNSFEAELNVLLNGDIVGSKNVMMEIPSNAARFITTFTGFPISEPGLLKIVFKSEPVTARLELPVRKIEAGS